MAETTGATPPPDEPSPVAEPEVPNVVGVLVALSCTERIQHDFGVGWDITGEGSLRVIGIQTGGRTRDIAEYAQHTWEHVSLVFEGDD